MYDLTPTAALDEGETVITSFHPDRGTYWKDHIVLAAVAMAIGMAVLFFMGNPHIWTGAVGGLAAVAVRAFYVASDEMQVRWDLTNRRLLGPGQRIARLDQITALKTFGSAVQVVTSAGDKHLLKFQADKQAVIADIRAAMRQGG
ncbi:hypothetical protein [Octadecabacter sp. R77987]|uniref:hypothetical protein n=1 Tax=Octadecabacter sp. R77987 TaxID=3093874 RepID=UPI00366AF964